MILGGAAKSFKSFFGLELCRALILGDAPFGHPAMLAPTSTRVLLLEDEIKERGLQIRGRSIFKGISTDVLNEQLFVVSGVPDVRLDSKRGFDLLQQTIEQTQPNVLVLDPWSRFIGNIDENKNDLIGGVLTKLDRLLAQYSNHDMSLVIIAHSKKPDSRKETNFDALSPHALRGGSRLYGNPDSILMIDRVKTSKNAQGHKMGLVAGRFELRHGEGFAEDLLFTFNEKNDLRVLFSRGKEVAPRLTNKPTVAPEQQKLIEA